MAYLLDLLLMAILVLFFLRGWKKGFAAGLVSLIGTIASVVLAMMFGGMISDWVYTSFIREPLAGRIAAQLTVSVPTEAEIRTLLDSFPAFLERALAHYGITAQSLASQVSGGGDLSYTLADAISPVFITVLKFLVVLVLFLAFMMLARLFTKMLCAVFELPLIRQLNEALGGVFGLLKGVLVVWLVCASLNIAVPMMKNSMREIAEQNIHTSILFDVVYEHNPIYALLR